MCETDTALSLDDALANGAYWLNKASRWADRYCIGVDGYGDGISGYFCRDCGLQIADADEGCEHCGFGQPIDETEC